MYSTARTNIGHSSESMEEGMRRQRWRARALGGEVGVGGGSWGVGDGLGVWGLGFRVLPEYCACDECRNLQKGGEGGVGK
jgi:hypothetical protein